MTAARGVTQVDHRTRALLAHIDVDHESDIPPGLSANEVAQLHGALHRRETRHDHARHEKSDSHDRQAREVYGREGHARGAA